MDVNEPRNGGATIFHIICSKGDAEFAEYLLSKVRITIEKDVDG